MFHNQMTTVNVWNWSSFLYLIDKEIAKDEFLMGFNVDFELSNYPIFLLLGDSISFLTWNIGLFFRIYFLNFLRRLLTFLLLSVWHLLTLILFFVTRGLFFMGWYPQHARPKIFITCYKFYKTRLLVSINWSWDLVFDFTFNKRKNLVYRRRLPKRSSWIGSLASHWFWPLSNIRCLLIFCRWHSSNGDFFILIYHNFRDIFHTLFNYIICINHFLKIGHKCPMNCLK